MNSEPVSSTQSYDEGTKGSVHDLPGNEKIMKDPEEDAGVPDGGWRAWSNVLGVLLLQFSTYGYTNAHGVYTDFYVREYLTDYSSSSISWIGGVQFALSFLVGPVSGPLFDAGHFKLMCYTGCTLFSFSLFMLSLAKPNQFYQIFLTQGVGLGLGIGITYIPGMGVISQHFQRHRAIAMGIAASGSALGGLIHPIVVNQLLQTRLGFAGTVRVSAGLVTFTMILASILIQPRYPKNKELKRRPINLGTNIRKFFGEPAFVFASLGTFTALLGTYFPNFFLQLNAIKRGIDPKFAFYTISILNAANFFGRIIPNLLVPRFGVFNAMISVTFCCAILTFALDGVTDIAGTVVFCILFGFFSGAYVGLVAPLISSLAHTDAEIGSRVGICLFVAGFSALTSSPIAGALLGPNFKWINPIVFAGTGIAVSSLCFAISRYPVSKKKNTWKV